MNESIDVYLVNAGNDPMNNAGIANDGAFPHLAIATLGTYLQHHLPGLAVKIRDGQAHRVTSAENSLLPERIKQDIDTYRPKIVGISTLSTSYQTALAIAKYAHDRGAVTVLGNDHVRDLSHAIMRNRDYVDFAIGHEYGETPLEMLVRNVLEGKKEYASIPSLTYRTDDGEVAGFDFNDEKQMIVLDITSPESGYGYPMLGALNRFPLTDRSLYDKEDLAITLENHNRKFSRLLETEITGAVTINNARGCNRWNDRCNYCDLHLKMATASAERMWADIKQAHQQTGANVFYEVCDSLTTYIVLIERLQATKYKANLGFEPHLFVYGQASDLVRAPWLAQTLKDIGVFRLNIGLDSMADETLQYMKGTKHDDGVETNLQALRLAKRAGIHVYASFVLGSAAETPQTLRQTVDYVKYLLDNGLLSEVEVQPLLPLPGNAAWKLLMTNPSLLEEIIRSQPHPDWPLNVDELSQVYVDNFSKVKYDDVVRAANEIRAYAEKKHINFGSGLGSAEKFT